MKATAIIQARMASTRLPGKVLLPAAGKPLLWHMIDRVRYSRLVDHIVIATTDSATDDPVAEFCRQRQVTYFRGSESDVLDRFHKCASAFGIRYIARMTADDPLQEPEVNDYVIGEFFSGEWDYASNTLRPTYPDGFDIEVFTSSALERAWREAILPSEREHVTPYIKKHPELFRCKSVEDNIDRSELNWALDTQKDYVFVQCIFERLGSIEPYFRYSDILQLLESAPSLGEINGGSVRDIGYLKSLELDNRK